MVEFRNLNFSNHALDRIKERIPKLANCSKYQIYKNIHGTIKNGCQFGPEIGNEFFVTNEWRKNLAFVCYKDIKTKDLSVITVMPKDWAIANLQMLGRMREI